MKIRTKTALDLIYCYKQINLCYNKEIIKVQEYPGKGQFGVFSLEDSYYITNSDSLLEISKEINEFIEDFYCKVKKAEIIIYTIEVIDEQIMRFDGLLFVFYDLRNRTPRLVDWNKVDPEIRSKYFAKVLTNVV